MNPEAIPDDWRRAFARAEELDPIIHEALRPVYVRLQIDARDQLPVFALAMICRALRTVARDAPVERRDDRRDELAATCAAYVRAYPDHP